jgi:hypothetical protein
MSVLAMSVKEIVADWEAADKACPQARNRHPRLLIFCTPTLGHLTASVRASAPSMRGSRR